MASQEAEVLVTVTIDGVEYKVPKGANLIDVCLKAGRDEYDRDYPDQNRGGPHYVPHFCYHPGLSVSGNCRMCFVKTKQMVKRGDKMVAMEMMTTACTNVVSDGLEVDTRSDEVQKVRRGIMELELINHPLDCPECDKAGECSLQDYAFEYGNASSKFDFEKSNARIKPLSEMISFWGTRCILCSRCIRVCDEISGTSELAFVNRADQTDIDIFPGRPLDNPLALNTVEVCPVGALNNNQFLYNARVWNLDEMAGLCGLCAKGCSIRVDSENGRISRVMARENLEVNDFWICDRGRNDFKWANGEKRLARPLTRKGEVSWDKGYTLAVEGLKKAAEDKNHSWALAGAGMTNEELYLFRKLVKERLGIENVALVAAPDVDPIDLKAFKAPADGSPNLNGAAIILGIDDAAASLKPFIEQCAAGKVSSVFVFGALAHGLDGLEEVSKALASERAENIVAIDFQSGLLTELAHVTLPCTTSFETAGSWVNGERRLQAFRAALPWPVEGRVGVEILQELLFRTEAKPADGAEAPAESGDEDKEEEVVEADPLFEARQRASGSATVAVVVGGGEQKTRTKRVIVGPAAIFEELAAKVPQFGGHSHLALVRSKGAKLL